MIQKNVIVQNHSPSLICKLAAFQGVTSADIIHRSRDQKCTICIGNIALPLQNGSSHITLDPILWATPKKRTSHSKKRLRMTHKWLKPIHHYTFCSKCGNPKLLHVLCGHCFKETMKLTAEYRRMKEQECKEDDVLNEEHNTVSTKQNS